MTLDRAIKCLQRIWENYDPACPFEEQKRALELGVEALKRVKKYRILFENEAELSQLEGETKN